jgi:hypothetical protein
LFERTGCDLLPSQTISNGRKKKYVLYMQGLFANTITKFRDVTKPKSNLHICYSYLREQWPGKFPVWTYSNTCSRIPSQAVNKQGHHTARLPNVPNCRWEIINIVFIRKRSFSSPIKNNKILIIYHLQFGTFGNQTVWWARLVGVRLRILVSFLRSFE